MNFLSFFPLQYDTAMLTRKRRYSSRTQICHRNSYHTFTQSVR